MKTELVSAMIGVGSTLIAFWVVESIKRWLHSRRIRNPNVMMMAWLKAHENKHNDSNTRFCDLERRMRRAEKHLQTIEPDWEDGKAITEAYEPKAVQQGVTVVPGKSDAD